MFARGIIQDGGYRFVALMEDGIPIYPGFGAVVLQPGPVRARGRDDRPRGGAARRHGADIHVRRSRRHDQLRHALALERAAGARQGQVSATTTCIARDVAWSGTDRRRMGPRASAATIATPTASAIPATPPTKAARSASSSAAPSSGERWNSSRSTSTIARCSSCRSPHRQPRRSSRVERRRCRHYALQSEDLARAGSAAIGGRSRAAGL